MSYKLKSLKKVDNNKVLLDLEIANNHLMKSMNTAYKDISEKAKIPGFRKGKIPYNIIDINFGQDYVLNEAATLSISELYPRIVDESKIKPIDYPQVKINSIGKDKPLNFEITVEVEPEVGLPKYKGIEVTGISEAVYDEEIESQIEKLRSNYATLEPVEEKRAAEQGDFVIVDFEGKIDGNDFEGNSAQDYTLEIGSKTLFEEFEKALVGMKKGAHKEISLTLPENISNSDLSGKKAQFSIDLKEIKRKILPELNEDFISNFGEYKTVDEFKDFLAERISDQKKKARRDRIISEIMDNLVANSKFEAPEPMIKNRISRYNEDLEKELSSHKISREDYLKTYNITEQQFAENIRQSAIREIKEYLLITALDKAEASNIEPPEEQVLEEYEKVISAYQKEEEKKRLKEYFDSQNGRQELKNGIRRRNLFDLLIKSAKIKEEEKPKSDKSVKRKLWTPAEASQSQQDQSSEKKLWVPGSVNSTESEEKNE